MRSKICILGYIVFAAAVFLVDDIRAVTVASFALFLLMVLLPYRKLKTGVFPITIFLSVTFLSNALFNPGKIVFESGPVLITEEGLVIAVVRTLRVFLLIAGAKFLTLLIDLASAIKALGDMLGPFEKIGLPVKRLFETMALSVQILPSIRKRIHNEYRTRIGVTGGKSIKDKAAVVFRFLLPLFFESIHNPGVIMEDRDDVKKRVEDS